jgi:hypothetical protein
MAKAGGTQANPVIRAGERPIGRIQETVDAIEGRGIYRSIGEATGPVARVERKAPRGFLEPGQNLRSRSPERFAIGQNDPPCLRGSPTQESSDGLGMRRKGVGREDLNRRLTN